MPFNHFDHIAGLYDRFGKFNPGNPLLGLLPLSSKDILLDAGGGTGRVSMALRSLVQETIVVDISRAMLQRAVSKGLAAACAKVESLPFPSASFNKVLMVDALHHVQDQRLAAREFWRILVPGGRILIVEPDIRKFSARLIGLGEKLLLMHSHFLTVEGIKSLFTFPGGKVEVHFDEFNVFFAVEKVRWL
jgi:ubiquinone/menaquinone biosynthesis C-methylase UbiE